MLQECGKEALWSLLLVEQSEDNNKIKNYKKKTV